jgi:hypothetical protein
MALGPIFQCIKLKLCWVLKMAWTPTPFPDSFDGRYAVAITYLPKAHPNECSYVYPLPIPYRVDLTHVDTRAILCKSVDGFMHVCSDRIADGVTHVVYRQNPKVKGIDRAIRGWTPMENGPFWAPGEILVHVNRDSPQKHKDICKYMYAMNRAVLCDSGWWSDVDKIPYNPDGAFIMRIMNWRDAIDLATKKEPYFDYRRYGRKLIDSPTQLSQCHVSSGV